MLDESEVEETLADDDWARDSDFECPTVAVDVPVLDGEAALLDCDAEDWSYGSWSPSVDARTCEIEEGL